MEYFLILLLVASLLWWFLARKKKAVVVPLKPGYVELLEKNVPYYQSLPDERKRVFANRVSQFLATINIEGVETEVEELDKVLVASSAIIPIFAFDGWEYPNLTTVLLYPGTFTESYKSYETEGEDLAIMGQVGEGGALQSTMALSKPALRNGFAVETSKENTGIHEFVHLLDKVDGAIDGTPEYMIPKEYMQPWLRQIQQNMEAMKASKTDINPYGATNEAEFFAVVSEYFFKRPDMLQSKHPELFVLLERIFRQNPLEPDKVLTEEPGEADD